MPNKNTDPLFQLIKSLQKAEKRNFKLYVQRNSGMENLKVVQLFDALDKMDNYDEVQLLRKNPSIKKQQLSNSKAHLYKQILNSLRLIKDEENIDMLLHEQMDYARILYNKGLYLQSLKVLEKLKEAAASNNQITYQLQAILFEKKIEALHITRSITNRAEQLSIDAEKNINQLWLITKLSNLGLELYSWFIQYGHARNQKDVVAIKTFFENKMPTYNEKELGFYEKLYLYQSYCWYGFILYDLLMYYRYAQKWHDLFDDYPSMKATETSQYIRGFHNLLSAHFMLGNYIKFDKVLNAFETFNQSTIGQLNTNAAMQGFVYLYISKINKYLQEGNFKEGIALIPSIEQQLEAYSLQLDSHRILIFYYKFACLYFGDANYDKAIKYLQKIINWKVSLRNDVQCYARLLHLLAHYELDNFIILESLIKSIYRFMANMNNLSVVEEEIFKFIRKSFSLSPNKLINEFKALKDRFVTYESNVLEKRSLMYLDVISWLESKIENVPIQVVIKRKYLQGGK